MIPMEQAGIVCVFLVFGPGTHSIQATELHPGERERGLNQTCEAELVEEIRIGTVDGPDEYMFGQIQDLAVGPGGSIYVADLHPQSVKRFDRRGRFVHRIGREGAGPGEYRSILGISTFSDGRVAVWDGGNRRISVYDSAGAYSEGVRVAGGANVRDAFQIDTLGRFYVKVRTGLPSVSAGGLLSGGTHGYMRMSSEGSVLDTVFLPLDNPTRSFLFSAESGARLRPFPVEELYGISPLGYLVVGSNERYSFTIRDPNGFVTVEREGFEPAIVKGEERREWQSLAEYNERRSGLAFPEIPRRKPAFRHLWVDADGRIWVHRYVDAVERDLPRSQRTRSGTLRPNITWREPPVFDVYTSHGEFLWCVELPWRARQSASQGLLIWGILKGSLDEEYVVRWRIIRRSGDSAEKSPNPRPFRRS